MALNTFKGNYLTPLQFKGLMPHSPLLTDHWNSFSWILSNTHIHPVCTFLLGVPPRFL